MSSVSFSGDGSAHGNVRTEMDVKQVTRRDGLPATWASTRGQGGEALVCRLLNSFNNWDWWPLPMLCVFC